MGAVKPQKRVPIRNLDQEHRASNVDEEKKFKCSLCDRAYKYKKGLKRHEQHTHAKKEKSAVRVVKNNSKKPYECKECSARFVRDEGLRRHTETIHKDVRSYACNLCSKAFKRKDHLSRHQRRLHNVYNSSFIDTTLSLSVLDKYRPDSPMSVVDDPEQDKYSVVQPEADDVFELDTCRLGSPMSVAEDSELDEYAVLKPEADAFELDKYLGSPMSAADDPEQNEFPAVPKEVADKPESSVTQQFAKDNKGFCTFL